MNQRLLDVIESWAKENDVRVALRPVQLLAQAIEAELCVLVCYELEQAILVSFAELEADEVNAFDDYQEAQQTIATLQAEVDRLNKIVKFYEDEGGIYFDPHR